ncbi:MAG: DUF4168 domain-containing protein [Hyphomonadaceae bacterium]
MSKAMFAAIAATALFGASAWAAPASGAASDATNAAPQAATPGAAAGASATYTDAQLQAFAAASAEMQPIQQRPNASTDPQALADMRAVLERHHLDSATYNAIAQRMRADSTFAARVAALRTNTPRSE